MITYPGLALPEFAPLPEPFIRFLFDIAPHNRCLPPMMPASEVDRPERVVDAFLYVRAYTYFYTAPLRDLPIKNSWVSEAVQHFTPGPRQPQPKPSAIHDWHARGLLRYRAYGRPDLNSVSSILILRGLNLLQRNWLPTRARAEEPFFYVWGVQSSSLVPVVYPLPLPEGIAPDTLLYSPWAGVPWTFPGFRAIQSVGSIGWAGYDEERDLYTMSWEQIERWSRLIGHENPPLFPENLAPGGVAPMPGSLTPYEDRRRHTRAAELLYHVGERQLRLHFAGKISEPPENEKESLSCLP